MRTLADQVAALKAELAAKKALEISERNREAGGAGSAAVRVTTMSPLTEARGKAAAEAAVAAAAAAAAASGGSSSPRAAPAVREAFAPEGLAR